MNNFRAILIKNSTQGSGAYKVGDSEWNKILLLNNGYIKEDSNSIVLIDTQKNEYYISKLEPLRFCSINNHYHFESKIFNIYEGNYPNNMGYFLLYNFKDDKRKNEYVFAQLGGMAQGSTFHFEAISVAEF